MNIYFVHQICAASFQEWQLFENSVYFAQFGSTMRNSFADIRPFHTRPKKRIQCASNAHSSCSHLNPVLGDAHSMRIESIHLRRWIATESQPNSLFIHRVTIKSCMVTPPWTATLSKLSRLGHHTCCIRRPRYKLWWPIMLGHYWLDAVEKETAYQVVLCSSSKFTFHVVYYQQKGKANNWMDFSVC